MYGRNLGEWKTEDYMKIEFENISNSEIIAESVVKLTQAAALAYLIASKKISQKTANYILMNNLVEWNQKGRDTSLPIRYKHIFVN